MQLLKYKYSTHDFITCLKSIRLYQKLNTSKYEFQQNDMSNLNQILTVIYTILKIRTTPIQKRLRLHNLISSYSSHAQKKYNLLICKYIQQFAYEYKKYTKYILTTYIRKEPQSTIYSITCTYIYIVHKLLKSKNPIFIYYFLIKKNNKA